MTCTDANENNNALILIELFKIIAAYSLQCYKCGPYKEDETYTTDQCEKDQKMVNCTNEEDICFKMHVKYDYGREVEERLCMLKSDCEDSKETCEDDEQKKAAMIKECAVACCASDGDKPCNSGFTVSVNVTMLMIMLTVFCNLSPF